MGSTDKQHFTNRGEFLSVHEAILQTLDANIGGDFFDIEPFENSINKWDGLPIVYAAKHPDMIKFATSPDEALKEIDGVVVGSVTAPKIERTGHARLMGNPLFTNMQEELDSLIELGKLSLSTGFFGVSENGKIITVEPNHLLVFKEEGTATPNDRGSGFLNMRNKFEEVVNQLRSLFDNKENFKEDKQMGEEGKKEPETKPGPTAEELLTEMQKKHDAEMLMLNQKLQANEAELKKYHEADVAHAEEIKNQRWTEVKNMLPVGVLKGEGKEEELKKEFDADPQKFTVSVLNMVKKVPGPGQQEGEEFTNQSDKDTVEMLKDQRELLKTIGRV